MSLKPELDDYPPGMLGESCWDRFVEQLRLFSVADHYGPGTVQWLGLSHRIDPLEYEGASGALRRLKEQAQGSNRQKAFYARLGPTADWRENRRRYWKKRRAKAA